jgi:hypothetical protein
MNMHFVLNFHLHSRLLASTLCVLINFEQFKVPHYFNSLLNLQFFSVPPKIIKKNYLVFTHNKSTVQLELFSMNEFLLWYFSILSLFFFLFFFFFLKKTPILRTLNYLCVGMFLSLLLKIKSTWDNWWQIQISIFRI